MSAVTLFRFVGVCIKVNKERIVDVFIFLFFLLDQA